LTDATFHLLTQFRDDVPLPTDAVTQRIYEQVAGKRSRPRGLMRRRRATLVVAVAALLLAAASLAAVKEVPWWQDGVPPVDPAAVASVARDNMPANVDVSRARTVATAGDAALIAVPLGTSGYCLIPALDRRATLGAQCDFQVADVEHGRDDRIVSAIRLASTSAPARWIVYGRVTDPRAAKLDLGAMSVDLASGGFFLTQVPNEKWQALSGSANHGAILNSAGDVLRRGCVSWGPSPLAPDSGAGGRLHGNLWSEASGRECRPEQIPEPPTIDLAHTRELFDVTLTQNYSVWKAGQRVSFAAAPASDGTTCVVVVAPPPPFSPAHGCNGTTIHAAGNSRGAIEVGTGAQLAHAADGTPYYAWNINGSTDPARHIAKLELRSSKGTTAVALGSGFFFAQLPETTPGPRVGTVPLPPGPWLLVGYDAAGNEVARVDLVELHRQASPH
jgi:hypothetical protein